MQGNRSRDTAPEVRLRSALHRTGLRSLEHRRPVHATFTIDTGIQGLLPRPPQPVAARSNENTIRLLRQYMPKGTDLSGHGAEDLARMARSLNNRPWQDTLNYETIREVHRTSCAHRLSARTSKRSHEGGKREGFPGSPGRFFSRAK
jgi:hypothetical protein